MKYEWDRLQQDVANCRLCERELPEANVECPPGLLYPGEDQIPDDLRVLFVGVAPPRAAEHFYSDPRDGLRRGLFGVLGRLGRQCSSIDEFLAHGFFLTHTAKCPIQDTWKPSAKVSAFCSGQWLSRELEVLEPRIVCWLSKGVGFPLAREMAAQAGAQALRFGVPSPVALGGGKPALWLATTWPGRGYERTTERDLAKVL